MSAHAQTGIRTHTHAWMMCVHKIRPPSEYIYHCWSFNIPIATNSGFFWQTEITNFSVLRKSNKGFWHLTLVATPTLHFPPPFQDFDWMKCVLLMIPKLILILEQIMNVYWRQVLQLFTAYVLIIIEQRPLFPLVRNASFICRISVHFRWVLTRNRD